MLPADPLALWTSPLFEPALVDGPRGKRIIGGGSLPVVGSLKRLLGTDTLLFSFGLDDGHVHSPNEKFELACYRHGARAHVRLLSEFAA